MSASLLDLAFLRAGWRYGRHPKGTYREARALWIAATRIAPIVDHAPSIARLADGVVALTRLQAARGIRTIAGRALSGLS